MSCCTNPMWNHLITTGAFTEESVRAALPVNSPRSAPTIGAIDTILLDATFLLAEPTVAGEEVTAVALSGDTIADVGDATRIIRSAPGAKQVSLNNTVLAPGFVEAHAHITMAVQTLYMTDLGHNTYSSYQAVLDKIAADVATAADQAWLFYMNFDPSLLGWTDEGFHQLGFSEFDAIPNSGKVNIFVQNASGHIAYANRTAFQTANIHSNPAGGTYQVIDGNYTGVMFEPPTFTPFLDNAPNQPFDKVMGSMIEFLRQAQQVGITTVADPAVGIGGHLELELSVFACLANDPKRPTDVVGSLDLTTVYPPSSTTASKDLPSLLKKPAAAGATGSYLGLVIPALKLWADGSTQGYTAYLSEAYLQPVTPVGLGDYGNPDWTQEQLNDFLASAKEDNWSILIHTNGDNALSMALDAIEKVYGAKSGFRTRVEHCTVARSDQYDRMHTLGVTPTYLINHIYIWGDTLNDHVLGNARANRLDCASEAIQRGMIFSFHCDYSVSMPNPLRYMQTAVTRTTSTGTVLGSEYAIAAIEALEGVTIYPAQQLGIDATIGSITAGKYANFVNLATDPTTCPSDQIASTKIIATYLCGVVHALGS